MCPGKTSFVLTFGCALFCAAAACHPNTAAPPAPAKAAEAPAAVRVIHPHRGPVSRFITLPGEVKPFQQSTLYAKVAGYLKAIRVDKGDRVKEGDLLAEIEVPELLADAAKNKAEVELAEIDFRRVSEAQQRAPDLVTALSVDTAKSRREVAKANLERAQTLLSFARITAPFSGVVTRRMADPGAFIPAATGGAPQNAAILVLADFSKVRVQVAVPEMEAAFISEEQPAKISADALPGRSFDGRITRYSWSLDETTKTMLAEIELPNPALELRPGMYANVKIAIQRKEQALLLPVEALVTEKAGAFVFAMAGAKAKKIRVKTGFNDGTHFEITDGIQPNESVLIPVKGQLTDGQAVQIVQETEAR